MHRSPSIVPQDADHDMYLVLLEAFGSWVGRAWRETGDDASTYREILIRDLLCGQPSGTHRRLQHRPGMVAQYQDRIPR